MDILITKNNKTISLSEYGIVATDFNVSSIPLRPIYEELEGRSGTVDYGSTDGTREITVPFYFESHIVEDFSLIRDELFHLIGGKNSFFVTDPRQQSKRYKVRLSNSFSIEQIYKVGQSELLFETTELPYAESINTTSEGIEDYPYRGIPPVVMNELEYTHTGTSFRIYNAGNVPIHPFQQELKITISEVEGSTNYLQLQNVTNGTPFRVNEGVANQTIVLDGPNITSNGLQYLRNTNKEFIELETGWNDFELTGATSAKVEFDFRLYFY
ncbi:phage tail family protein [Virgibacillus sp. C22-A2]|uniref:Phage tail family protein n=1 Tax=Virgibacillus tibetensis TaxID=3042313 RepID=A0ABU6KAF5_9BACI|nr:phage tail family protein [Virgibacillus sp. C22-A2]